MAALDTQGMQTCPATDSIPPGSCWTHWCCPASGHRGQPGHSHLGLQPTPTACCPEPWLGTEEQAPRGARTFQLLPCGHPSKQGSGELQPRGMGTSSPALCAARAPSPAPASPSKHPIPAGDATQDPAPAPPHSWPPAWAPQPSPHGTPTRAQDLHGTPGPTRTPGQGSSRRRRSGRRPGEGRGRSVAEQHRPDRTAPVPCTLRASGKRRSPPGPAPEPAPVLAARRGPVGESPGG